MPTERFFTSRSAYQDLRACPRLRWWGWEFLRGLPLPWTGRKDMVPVHPGGLAPAKTSIYLLTGIGVHAGFGHLLNVVKESGSKRVPTQDEVDQAVKLALDGFNLAIAKGGVSAPKCDLQYVDWKTDEARGIVEGFIRAFATQPIRNFVDCYEVLEVEVEDTTELSPGSYFQSRADGLLRNRQSGGLNVLSLKTATDWGQMNELEFRRDVQGLTEALGIEARPGWVEKYGRIEMTQMLVCVKGRQYQDRENPGLWVHYCPLTRAFKADGVTNPFSTDVDLGTWAWSYDVPKRNQKTGDEYMGRLGSGWTAHSVWNTFPGGTKAWVEALVGGEIQKECGSPIDKLFLMPEPWGRSDREMVAMQRQMAAAEAENNWHAQEVREYYQSFLEAPSGDTYNNLLESLDERFPQNKQSCVRYGGLCPMDSICHGSAEVLERVLAADLENQGFKLRDPHHSGVGALVQIGA